MVIPGRPVQGILTLLFLLFIDLPLPAQTIQGRMLLEGDTTSLSGVTVTLLNDHGNPLARVQSGDEGWFRVRAGSPGSYLLTFSRIGLQPVRASVTVLSLIHI